MRTNFDPSQKREKIPATLGFLRNFFFTFPNSKVQKIPVQTRQIPEQNDREQKGAGRSKRRPQSNNRAYNDRKFQNSATVS
jgi:hypothetical protein